MKPSVSNKKIFGIIKRILVEQLGLKDEISMDSHLERDLGLDSLDRMELIVNLEEKLGLEIGEDVAPDINTISELINIISNVDIKL